MHKLPDPELVEFYLTDGVYVRQIALPNAGTLVPQHSHQWNHHTFVASGEVKAWKDGIPFGVYKAPTAIFIEAGAKHSFLTTELNTVLYCIHALHSADKVAILEEHEITPEELTELGLVNVV
jgi:quercetin dioxygenase-like cupin family protein